MVSTCQRLPSQTHTHTQRQTHTHTHAQTHRERERERQSDRHTANVVKSWHTVWCRRCVDPKGFPIPSSQTPADGNILSGRTQQRCPWWPLKIHAQMITPKMSTQHTHHYRRQTTGQGLSPPRLPSSVWDSPWPSRNSNF